MTSEARSLRYRLMMEVGDIAEVDRALDEWTALADELGQPAIRWLVGWPRTHRLMLAGRLAEAERWAVETMELGFATGQRDAAMIYTVGLLSMRLQQGRLGEFEPQFLDTMERYGVKDGLPLAVAARALIDADVGGHDRARLALESMAASGFAGCSVDVTWFVVMALWAEIAAALGDSGSAVVLRRALQPFRDRVACIATMSIGTIAFHLGLLAATAGDFDAADSDFAHAEAIEERIGAPIWLARTRLEWARMLLRRSGAGDAQRARDLLTQALAAARDLRLPRLEAEAGALLLDAP